MPAEKWSYQLEVLTKELRPHLREFRRDDPFLICFKKRLQLVKYIQSFADRKSKRSRDISVAYLEGGKFKSKCPEEAISSLPQESVRDIKEQILRENVDNEITSVGNEETEWKLPKLKDGENLDFPSSSSSLQVEYSESKGRHVRAKCDINMGDVLFIEKPFSFVVLKAYCSNCCQSASTYVQCVYCRDVQFCSEKCREIACKSYHQYECGFIELLKETGIAHLALRIILQASSSIEELQKITKVLSDKKNNNNTAFSKSQYENVYNLLSHAQDMEIEDLLQYSLTALLLSLYLTNFTNYATETEENVKFCAKLLLHHITQLVSNAHAITAITTTAEGDFTTISEEQEQIASAIYPSVSMMNHSCEPSIFNVFYKYYIIVRACKDIKKGEEIFNSYGINCRRMKREKRQKLLKSQYMFDCNCGPCSEEFDCYDILNSFKCGECLGPLVKEDTKKMEKLDNQISYLCLVCSSYQIIREEKFSAQFHITELIKRGEQKLYEENEVSEALKIFLNAWKLSRKLFSPFHKDLSYSANQIAQCLFLLGDYKKCLKFLACSVLCVEGRFGRYSSELAFEAKKLADIIRFYCCTLPQAKLSVELYNLRSKGYEYSELSEKIFTLLYGSDHPVVCEVRQTKSYFR